MILFLILCAVAPQDKMQEAKALTFNSSYEESLSILYKIKAQDVDYNDYCYLRAINHYSLNQKEDAEYWIDKLLDSFSPLPERYKAIAEIMKYDMESWQDNGLDDISRDMKKVSDRLNHGKGGKDTQKIQKEVLDKLGKMIKEMEDKANKDQEEQDKKNAEEALKRKPLQDVELPEDLKASGKVDLKKVKEIAEVWGKMPEKERAKALVELTRTLPAKDKALIEDYFKELARKKDKR